MAHKLSVLNQLFDKIYVITLHRATSRQQTIKHILDGVDYDFFYGVDKLNLNFEQVQQDGTYDNKKAIQYHRNSKPMYLGQVACSLSHRKLYEHILQNTQYNKVLIFEDDFLVDEIAFTHIHSVLEQLPSSWDLLYLGYYLNEITTTKMKLKQAFYLLLSYLGLQKFKPNQIKNLYPKKYSANLDIAGFHDCAHAYCVNRKALLTLIKNQTPVCFPADTLFSYLIISEKIEAYISKPKIFLQEIFLKNGNKESFVAE
jgi:glycosyl transferase family 25